MYRRTRLVPFEADELRADRFRVRRWGGTHLRLGVTVAGHLAAHAGDPICHLVTTGRRTGRPRTIEIWFATDGERIYVLAGGRLRAHWVRNLQADPRVRVRLGGRTLSAQARIVDEPGRDALARRLLAAKYQAWTEGAPLSSWAAESLPVEIEPDAVPG